MQAPISAPGRTTPRRWSARRRSAPRPCRTVVRAHAPPQLRRLDDGPGPLEEARRSRRRCASRRTLGDAAAWEGTGEDLGADRVQAGVAAVEEGRVGGDREQQRQQLAQPVADGDRPVGAAHAHVDMQAPGVVALGDVAEFVAQAVVVRGVDDRLVEVAGPGMGARGAQRKPHLGDQGEEARAPRALALDRLGERLRAPGADLDLGVDQLAGGRVGQHLVALAGGVDVLETVRQLQRRRIEDRELLLETDREVGRGLESLASEVEI